MKKVLLIMLAALMIFAAVGCAAAPAEEAPAAAPAEEAPAAAPAEEAPAEAPAEEGAKELNITYLSPSTESQYWQYNEIGMRNAIIDLEAEKGVKINFSVAGPATEAETDAYIKAFESVIASGPDAIITATLAPDGTVPKTQEASEQGIYVNFCGMGLGDNNAPMPDAEPFFGVHYYCDNYVIGETAAKCMLDAFAEKGIDPKGTIGIHMSVVVETLEDRMNGFRDYMAANAPEIVCLDTLYNENDVNKAQANCETQISTYGDELIGLYGANNISGDGIALAISGGSLADKIVGIGVDSDSLEIEALAAGNLYAIIAQTPYEQGYNCMVNAVTYLLTGENTETEKHVNCPSQAVTKANMEDEAFAALLDPTILAK